MTNRTAVEGESGGHSSRGKEKKNNKEKRIKLAMLD